MASGSFSVTTSNRYITGTVSWSSVPNIGANTSSVTATLRLSRVNTGYETYGSGSFTLTINGASYTNEGTFSLTYNSGTLCVTNTVSVPHSADGTKSIAISVSGVIYAGSPNMTLSLQSGTAVLDTIPRASEFSLSRTSFDAGETVTAVITPAVSSFSHTLSWRFGTFESTQTLSSGTTQSAFTLPLSWLAAIPSSLSGLGSAVLTTKNGDTAIGTRTVNFTVSVPQSAVPTIESFSLSRVDGTVPASFACYVQNKSKVSFAVTGAAGVYGSEIASYSVSGGGYSFSQQSGTTGILQSSGTLTFTATVTDSRGKAAQKTQSITVLPYENPAVVSAYADRCLADGTLSNTGTYVKVTPVFTYSTVSGKNSLTGSAAYRVPGGTFGDETSLASGVSTVLGNGNFDVGQSYEIRITAADLFTSAVYTVSVPTSDAVLSVRPSGKGMGVGKYAENENLLDVAWDLRVRGDVNLDAPLSVPNGGTGANTAQQAVANFGIADFVTEEGRYGIWNYKKWNNGKLEAYGVYSAAVTDSNKTTWSNGWYFAGEFQSTLPCALIDDDFIVSGAVNNISFLANVTLTSFPSATVQFYIAAAHALDNGTYTARIYIQGKWK